MTEYAWPTTLRPSRLSFYLQHNTLRFVSPVTRATQVLRREGAGDHIGLGGRLYMATETVVASGAGTATIPIAPPLREAMLVSAPLVLTKPSVPMRLVSDDEAANPTRPGRFTAITIRMEEAL